MTITTADARRRLDELGALDRDVLLPGESTNPRQGALRVVKDGSWEVRSEEYGMTTMLVRATDEAEALDYVLDRVTAPLPAPLPYPRERLRQQWEAMARLFEPTVEQLRANPSVTGELALPEGAVVDRFGTFDGFLLHPAGTPFAARFVAAGRPGAACPGSWFADLRGRRAGRGARPAGGAGVRPARWWCRLQARGAGPNGA